MQSELDEVVEYEMVLFILTAITLENYALATDWFCQCSTICTRMYVVQGVNVCKFPRPLLHHFLATIAGSCIRT